MVSRTFYLQFSLNSWKVSTAILRQYVLSLFMNSMDNFEYIHFSCGWNLGVTLELSSTIAIDHVLKERRSNSIVLRNTVFYESIAKNADHSTGTALLSYMSCRRPKGITIIQEPLIYIRISHPLVKIVLHSVGEIFR